MLKWLSLTAEANNPRRITKRRESPATPCVEMRSKAAAPMEEIAVTVIFKPVRIFTLSHSYM